MYRTLDTLRAELVPVDGCFNLLRRVKSPLEIELLHEAVRVSELAIQEVQPLIKPGSTEVEISAVIPHVFNCNSCDTAFFPMVLA